MGNPSPTTEIRRFLYVGDGFSVPLLCLKCPFMAKLLFLIDEKCKKRYTESIILILEKYR